MPAYRSGDKVKVKEPSYSPFHGHIGTVVRTEVSGLAVRYEISFDGPQTTSPSTNKFFEFQLEPVVR